MRRFYDSVIRHRRIIIIVFLIMAAVMLVCKSFVSVNYNINDYLPADSPSTVAIDVMQEEFDGGIPNARIMISNVTVGEALEYKDKLAQIEGVTEVKWLDDVVSLLEPLETADQDVVETYYKDNNALLTLTIEEEPMLEAIQEIRALIGDENAMTGSAVSQSIATLSTVDEVKIIGISAVLFIFFILMVTTTSWIEPLIVMTGIGVAVAINAGSNLIFGEISFVTNAAGSILQMAVSLDYSVFLIHRFNECRQTEESPEAAMLEALMKSTSSIMSSGLTTVIGFFALVMMRFEIGPDLGLALAKGIAISLITVFIFMPGLILMTYRYLDSTQHKPFLPSFRKLGVVVSKLMIPLTIMFVLIILPSYLSSIKNDYYYGSSHIFGKGTQMGDDTAKIDSIFGENDNYVLLVPKGDTAKEKSLSDEINNLDHITSVISYVDQVGTMIPYEYLDEETLSLLESEHYSKMVISAAVGFEGERTTGLIDEIRASAKKYYGKEYHLAGEGVSTYDLKDTVLSDMIKVNFLAIGAVLVVLFFTVKSISLPFILVLTIETAIWVNLSFPYYLNTTVFYIAYLITSSIQLGATVDYAILFTDRYKENRQTLDKKDSVIETVSNVTVSLLSSCMTMAVVGTLMGVVSSHGLLSQLGYLLGRGAICSIFAVLFILPGFLYIFDRTFINRRGLHDMKQQRREKKRSKKITAGLLVLVLVLSQPVYRVQAAEVPGAKEEIVYAMLDANGNGRSVHVVNVFRGGDIVDYGNYTKVRNMSTTDKITLENGVIRCSTDAEKLYYQGDLERCDLPWNISIRYLIDGKEYAPDDIAGMSGALKIKVSITRNNRYDISFWDGYALETTILLDTELCKNIVADGATMANVAANKQLSYIILPGKGKDFEITADVKDFEMESISLNAVRLNLNMEFDDSELQEKVGDIKDAVSELNDGASKLSEGAGSLDSGVEKMTNGIAKIQDALSELDSNSSTLTDGSAQVLAALENIQTALSDVSVDTDNLSDLSDASTQINQGIASLVEGLKTMSTSIENYYQELRDAGLNDTKELMTKNDEAIKALGITQTQRDIYEAYTKGEAGTLGNGPGEAIKKIMELAEAGDEEAGKLLTQCIDPLTGGLTANGMQILTAYLEGAGKLVNLEILLTVNKNYIDGSNQVISGILKTLDAEEGQLMKGAVSLQTNYEAFNTAIQELVTKLSSLLESMAALKSGIDTLVSNYESLDSGINEYTGAVSKILAGYNTLYEGALSLSEGSGALYEGILELYDGTSTFESETSDMDTKITDTIDDTIDTMTGKNVKTISFVSDKNTNIDSVLFVMKTDKIELPEEDEPAEVEKEKRSIIEKFLDAMNFKD